VKMTIRVEDERGIPMPANLSLAVVDDQLLTFADDKSGNLLSSLMLEYDINEKVDEPAFYFDEKEEKADKALDYLLLTAGWRRFTWMQVLRDELPDIAYAGEKAIVSGRVLDGYTGKPIPNAKIKAGGKWAVAANEDGGFAMKGLDLTERVSLEISAPGYNQQFYNVSDYSQNLTCYLYNYNTRSHWNKSSVKLKSRRVPKMAGGIVDEMDMLMAEPLMAQMEEGAAEIGGPRNIEKVMDVAVEEEMDMEEVASKNDMKKEIMDDRLFRARMDNDMNIPPVNANLYYRAREFQAPKYKDEEMPEVRNDFRSTVYWNPNVEVGHTGKKVVEFYNSDDITSFRAIVEGVSDDGMVGRAEKKYFTQLPFSVKVKIPVEVATTDIVSIPLTIKNNTTKEISGFLSITAPKGLKPLHKVPELQTVAVGQVKTFYLDYEVLSEVGKGDFSVSYKACGLSDAFTRSISIVAKGFPVTASYSGNEKDAKYALELSNVVKGSITAQLTAFPSVVGDLLSGVEGILREPTGCFEQTSMSSYPNAMVLDYLQTTESRDEKLLASASGLLDRGYKRLTTFETPKQGYEWFGQAPAHEGLTAFGLMQFKDMQRVGGDVDQAMIDRTAKWIMSTKDGKGGFTRNTRAYHNFGSISEDVMNGYIVYALADAGYKNIKKEAEASFNTAMKTKDPYQLAMSACAMYDLGDHNKAGQALKALIAKQKADGSIDGTTHSITHSTGNSLTIETTSLGIMAMLKSPSTNAMALNKAVESLVKSRSGYGTFGNTQGTILALKALTEYAKHSRKTQEDGTIEVYVDGSKVATRKYKAGDKGAIVIDDLGKHITSGKHKIRVRYVGVSEPLPYSIAVSWNTYLPKSDEACNVR